MCSDDSPELSRVRVLRSKNAGPFAWTFDVVFREQADFQRATPGLTRAAIAEAYAVCIDDVFGVGSMDSLHAFKFSVRRPRPAGHPGDADCYGMNQEEPLAQLVCELLGTRPR